MSSNSDSSLNLAIMILTIIASICLFVSLVQQDIRFFEEGAWENDADCIVASRAYVLGIMAMMISFCVSSYRSWRDCLNSSNKSKMDGIFTDGTAIAGTLVFTSWILFSFFPRDFDFGDEGEKAMLVYSLCCFLLFILYLANIMNGRGKRRGIDLNGVM